MLKTWMNVLKLYWIEHECSAKLTAFSQNRLFSAQVKWFSLLGLCFMAASVLGLGARFFFSPFQDSYSNSTRSLSDFPKQV